MNAQETTCSLIKKHIQFIYKYFVSPRKTKFWKQCFRSYFGNSRFCFLCTNLVLQSLPAENPTVSLEPWSEINGLFILGIIKLKRIGKVIMTLMWNLEKCCDMGLYSYTATCALRGSPLHNIDMPTLRTVRSTARVFCFPLHGSDCFWVRVWFVWSNDKVDVSFRQALLMSLCRPSLVLTFLC